MPHDLVEVLRELTQLPPHETTDPQLRAERQERLKTLMPRLRAVLMSEEAQPAIARALEEINGTEGDPKSFDALHEFLNVQPYRLAYWRTSAEEINYRRFFDINDLVGLRMENPAVFMATHGLIRSLIATHKVTGLRIDHCDGMFNPRYIRDKSPSAAGHGVKQSRNVTTLSNHAFGSAFDINADDNPFNTRPALCPMRGCTRELVAAAA